MQQQKINQDGQFLCQKHGRLSFDICLHHSPMDNRLLCRLCKQELPQEKLVEVASLSDFFSGHFLDAPKDMVQQELKESQQKMNQDNGEKKIKMFFSDIEQGLISTLNEVKRKFFDKYSKNSKKVDEGNQLKKTIDDLSSEIEIFKADPHNRFYEIAFLNRFSQKYYSLIDASTKYVEGESTHQTASVQSFDKFELNSDLYKNFKELCLRTVSSLLEHYDEGNSSRTSSDGYVDSKDITVKLIQDDDGNEEEKNEEHKASQGQQILSVNETQKNVSNETGECQNKKSTNRDETNHPGYSGKAVDEKKTKEAIPRVTLAIKSVSTTRRLRRYEDSYETKENCNGENTAVVEGPALKKVKKTTPTSVGSRSGKSSATIEIEDENDDENPTQPEEEEEKMLEKLNPREVSIQPIYTLQGKYNEILWGGLCYIPDQGHIVAGDQFGNLCVWNAETRELLFHKYIAAKIYKIIYLSRKKVILVSREDGEIGIFDVKKNYSFAVCYKKHTKLVFSMVYISSLDLVGSSGEDGNIALWSYSQNSALIRSDRMLVTDNMQVAALCYIEDKDLLIAATFRGGYLTIFNPSVNQYITKIKAHNKIKSIDCLVYVPAWKQVVSGSEDSSMKFWDLSENIEELTCLKSLRRTASYIENIVVIPEANCLINTNMDPKLSVWNLVTDTIAYEMMGSTQGKRGEAMIYLEDRKELVTAFGNEIRLWQVKF